MVNKITKGYEPADVLGWFEEICRIPRGSGNEAGISAFLCDFAEKRGLEYRRDEYNNVLIRMPATAGFENAEPIMLQGHMDMVCEKNAGTDHDFSVDPLDIYVEDGKLRARGTTLGGDDGIAVAYMLAILDDPAAAHPDLECLITTGEETSMAGAGNFDYSQIRARRVINIDSEEEGIVTVSCAGGADVFFTLSPERLPHTGRTLKIALTGLAGGHSGTEINLGRANSIALMGRILAVLYDFEPFNLVSVNGGNKMNAIARECEAEIYVLDREAAENVINSEAAKIRRELAGADKKMKLRLSKGETNAAKLSYKDTSAVINMMRLYKTGVIAMENGSSELVRTSANMGRITTSEDGVTLGIMARSSSDSEMDALLLDYNRLSKALGVSAALEGRYAGWALNPVSRLSKAYADIYDRMYGHVRKAEISAVHAGLECGVIVAALGPETDAISIGPDMHNIHTPDEALDLVSVEHTWNVLKELIVSD